MLTKSPPPIFFFPEKAKGDPANGEERRWAFFTYNVNALRKPCFLATFHLVDRQCRVNGGRGGTFVDLLLLLLLFNPLGFLPPQRNPGHPSSLSFSLLYYILFSRVPPSGPLFPSKAGHKKWSIDTTPVQAID